MPRTFVKFYIATVFPCFGALLLLLHGKLDTRSPRFERRLPLPIKSGNESFHVSATHSTKANFIPQHIEDVAKAQTSISLNQESTEQEFQSAGDTVSWLHQDGGVPRSALLFATPPSRNSTGIGNKRPMPRPEVGNLPELQVPAGHAVRNIGTATAKDNFFNYSPYLTPEEVGTLLEQQTQPRGNGPSLLREVELSGQQSNYNKKRNENGAKPGATKEKQYSAAQTRSTTGTRKLQSSAAEINLEHLVSGRCTHTHQGSTSQLCLANSHALPLPLSTLHPYPSSRRLPAEDVVVNSEVTDHLKLASGETSATTTTTTSTATTTKPPTACSNQPTDLVIFVFTQSETSADIPRTPIKVALNTILERLPISEERVHAVLYVVQSTVNADGTFTDEVYSSSARNTSELQDIFSSLTAIPYDSYHPIEVFDRAQNSFEERAVLLAHRIMLVIGDFTLYRRGSPHLENLFLSAIPKLSILSPTDLKPDSVANSLTTLYSTFPTLQVIVGTIGLADPAISNADRLLYEQSIKEMLVCYRDSVYQCNNFINYATADVLRDDAMQIYKLLCPAGEASEEVPPPEPEETTTTTVAPLVVATSAATIAAIAVGSSAAAVTGGAATMSAINAHFNPSNSPSFWTYSFDVRNVLTRLKTGGRRARKAQAIAKAQAEVRKTEEHAEDAELDKDIMSWEATGQAWKAAETDEAAITKVHDMFV